MVNNVKFPENNNYTESNTKKCARSITGVISVDVLLEKNVVSECLGFLVSSESQAFHFRFIIFVLVKEKCNIISLLSLCQYSS